jgi:Na+/H+ antiporter NhaA
MAVTPTRLFQQFFKTEAAGGLLLPAGAGAALAAANSWADAYHELWATTVTVS